MTAINDKNKRTSTNKIRSSSGRLRPSLEFERLHHDEGRVAVGVDEVGRGCLAGPVVTAAVVLPEIILSYSDEYPEVGRLAPRKNEKVDAAGPWWMWVNDSKLVPAWLREQLAQLIEQTCEVQIAWCFPEEIDRWNILHAAMIAMRRAVWPFAGRAQAVLVDGNADPFHSRYRCQPDLSSRLGFTHVQTIVKGDQRSLSIAAASIVAKVYRDRWMSELEAVFPGYGFAAHKGYSTPEHYDAIARLGSCPIHRQSFAPFKKPKTGSADCKTIVNGQSLELFEAKATKPSRARIACADDA